MQVALGILIAVGSFAIAIGILTTGMVLGYILTKHSTDETEWTFDNAVDYVRYRGEVKVLCSEHSGEVVRGDMCEKCIIDAWRSKLD